MFVTDLFPYWWTCQLFSSVCGKDLSVFYSPSLLLNSPGDLSKMLSVKEVGYLAPGSAWWVWESCLMRGFWEVCQLVPDCCIIVGQVECSRQAKMSLRPPGKVPVLPTACPPVSSTNLWWCIPLNTQTHTLLLRRQTCAVNCLVLHYCNIYIFSEGSRRGRWLYPN